jgi:hypothetical protein
MDSIQPDSRFDACEGLEITEVPDGRVVYQASRQKVHYLNPTAIVVLELLSAGKTAAEAALFLKDAYSLAEIPTGSTNSCIQSLVGEGLLRPSTP